MITKISFLSNLWERALRECGNYYKKFRGMHTPTKNYQKIGREGGERTQPPLHVEAPGVKKSWKHPESGGGLDLSISNS